MRKVYILKYVGPEHGSGYEKTYDSEADVFLHLAEEAQEFFLYGYSEIDFDNKSIKAIVEALNGRSYKRLMKAINDYISVDGSYFSVSEQTEPATTVQIPFEERMLDIMAQVEMARVYWEQSKNAD